MVLVKNLKRKTSLITLLSLISIAVITFSYYNSLKLNKRNIQTTEKLHDISILLEKINGLEKEFMDFETINPKFHKTGNSEILNQTFISFHKVKTKLTDLSLRKDNASGIENLLDSLNSKIAYHNILIDSMAKCIKVRGFKDYGLIGDMRKEIHFVEKNSPYDNLASILMLRRHEKDYFLRRESQYITKVNEQLSLLNTQLKETNSSKADQKTYANALSKYDSLFTQIIIQTNRIGISRKKGLSGAINIHFNEIMQDINLVKQLIHAETKSKLYVSQTFYLIALIILSSVIVISLYTSSQLGKPIEKLSLSIQNAVSSNFAENAEIYKSRSQNEIAFIGENVQKMLTKIKWQKKFLLGKNIEVEEQNKILSIQKTEIDRAFETIEKKNKNLTDSITYAHHIQKSFLPTIESINNVFENNFVLYQPKDIVSGDFYLIQETETHQIIVVCDCTGHGVPGAFMTLLGNMLLDNCLKKDKRTIPHEILNYLDCRIDELLGNRSHLNSEGMDIAVCVINKQTNSLAYAGARSPLLLYQNNKWIMTKGAKRSIGEKSFDKIATREFITHNFNLKQGDKFFMWTDGYKDQFGGVINKKIGTKRLEQIIKMNVLENMTKLGDILQKELHAWRKQENKRYEQTDDILVVGIEINSIEETTHTVLSEHSTCC